MFDFVRKHTKIMQVILFLLILPSFVLFGLDGYTRMKEKGDVVAMVDGREILQSEWDAFHQREATRQRETNRNIDPKELDTPQAKYASLERLVNERVFSAAADKFKVTTADARLARDLNENESIANLRKADGSIDMARYAEMLSRQGMSPEMFESQVRRDMALRQVIGGVTQGAFATHAVVERSLGAFYERREAQVLRFVSGDFADKVNLSEADIKAYYEANPKQFQAPETADVEVLILDLKSIERTIQLQPEALRAYYEQNKAKLTSQEERRARHILVNVPKDASANVKAAARDKATALLAQVKAKPDSFADVASKNSDDTGSAAQGGDLDYFNRGMMVKPFEEKAFSMKKGDISDLVETEFGFHIIQLTDIKGAKEASFEELRPKIEADLRKAQAQTKFQEFAEPFSNSVFENPDNLQTTAQRFGLQVQVQAGVRRTPFPGATGPLTNPKLLNALFSPESIGKKANTPAIDLGGSQLVAGRVTKHQPARVMAFEEVQARAKTLAVTAKAQALAKAEGEKALAALKAGGSGVSLPAPTWVSRASDGPNAQHPKVVDAILRADLSKTPAFVGLPIEGLGYVVAQINKTQPREPSKPETARAEQRQLGEFLGNAEAMAYLDMLKKTFKTEIKVAKPAKVVEESLL